MPSDHLEKRREFREDFRFASAPLFEAIQANLVNARQFADTGIKAGLVLNGGGAVLVFGYLALFKTSTIENPKSIFATLFIFVIGLLCAWIVCFFSYFSANVMAEALGHRYQNLHGKYARAYLSDQGPVPSEGQVEAEDEKARDGEKMSIQLRRFAIVSAFASLASFIVAAILAANVALGSLG